MRVIGCLATVLALSMVAPAFAQYAGPAILLRGEAPAPMQGMTIDFRPFVEFTGSYDAGLRGVQVVSQGNPVNDKSFGADLTAGVSGNAVYIDGVDVTSPASTMAIRSGNLFGLAKLRDELSEKMRADNSRWEKILKLPEEVPEELAQASE